MSEDVRAGTGRARWIDAAGAAAIAVLVALPWLRQDLVACEWLGVAAALASLRRLRGWRGETLVLAAAAASLGTAFHWSPDVLAGAMQTSVAIGLAFTVPIVLWDAVRLALPFWFISRTVDDPRDAWLPAALVAVATESFVTSVFPWKLGYSQIAWPVLVQAADLLGPEAATFVLYAHAGVIVLAFEAIRRGIRTRPAPAGPLWTATAAAAVVVCLVNLAYGAWAMRAWAATSAAAPTFRVALVQVDPSRDDSIADLQRLSRQTVAGRDPPIDLVVWPECSGGSYAESLPSFADPERIVAASREPLRGLRPLADPGCALLFGGKIYRGYPERPNELFQSAILVDEAERIVGRYHKRHLMPFGEYVPGTDWLPELRHHFPLDDDLDVGPDATVLPLGPRARLGVMLCYEDMVPSAAASLVDARATVLISLINGSSFKTPLTLRQHRLLAQLRAVENRRCLLRCAATGETCVISPLGTITARLPLQVEDVLTAEVPLIDAQPPGRLAGRAFPAACGLAAIAVAWRRWRRPRA